MEGKKESAPLVTLPVLTCAVRMCTITRPPLLVAQQRRIKDGPRNRGRRAHHLHMAGWPRALAVVASVDVLSWIGVHTAVCCQHAGVERDRERQREKERKRESEKERERDLRIDKREGFFPLLGGPPSTGQENGDRTDGRTGRTDTLDAHGDRPHRQKRTNSVDPAASKQQQQRGDRDELSARPMTGQLPFGLLFCPCHFVRPSLSFFLLPSFFSFPSHFHRLRHPSSILSHLFSPIHAHAQTHPPPAAPFSPTAQSQTLRNGLPEHGLRSRVLHQWQRPAPVHKALQRGSFPAAGNLHSPSCCSGIWIILLPCTATATASATSTD